jgi:hypothetical protein
MDNRRFSLEEFKTLFPGPFESQEQLLREYRAFLAVFEHLDSMPVPDLSAAKKAEIFRRSWQARERDRLRLRVWLEAFRRPAVTFAAGIVLGCTLMLAVTNVRAGLSQPATTAPRTNVAPPAAAGGMLTIEQTGRTRVYKGKAIERLYPHIENPKIVLEKAEGSAPSQRVLYGTLDGGEVYVVWNL